MAQIAVDAVMNLAEQGKGGAQPHGATEERSLEWVGHGSGLWAGGLVGVGERLGWIKSLGGNPGDSQLLPGAGILTPGLGWRGESQHRPPNAGLSNLLGLVAKSIQSPPRALSMGDIAKVAKELKLRGYRLVVLQDRYPRDVLGMLAQGGLVVLSGVSTGMAMRAAVEMGTQILPTLEHGIHPAYPPKLGTPVTLLSRGVHRTEP